MVKKLLLPKLREFVEALFEDEGRESSEIFCLFHDIKAWIDENYRRPAHVYSQLKKTLKAHKPEATVIHELAASIFKQTPQELQLSQTAARRAVEKRNEEVTHFNMSYINQRMAMLMESCDPVDQCICLQLAIGCRQCDLFDQDRVTFTKIDASHVKQRGSSKADHNWEKIRWVFFLGADRFLKMLENFRWNLQPWEQSESEEDSTSRRISHWNKRLCKRTRFYFPVKSLRSGTHVNRALYASICRYYEEGEYSSKTEPRSIQEALGHVNISTALHYMYVKVGDGGFDGHKAEFCGINPPGFFHILIAPHRSGQHAENEYHRDHARCIEKFRQRGLQPVPEDLLLCGIPLHIWKT